MELLILSSMHFLEYLILPLLFLSKFFNWIIKIFILLFQDLMKTSQLSGQNLIILRDALLAFLKSFLLPIKLNPLILELTLIFFRYFWPLISLWPCDYFPQRFWGLVNNLMFSPFFSWDIQLFQRSYLLKITFLT